MKVLRKGQEFSHSRIQLYASKALWSFIAVLAVFALFKFELIGLLVLVFVLSLFNAGFRQWERWFRGKREKAAVRSALKRSWMIMPCSMV